jgi:hypothetical protein
MKIINAPATGSAMLHTIEGFDFSDGKLQVRVSALPLEQDKVLSVSAFTNSITAPSSLLGPDPMPGIEAWLVGPDGPYAGGVLVNEADEALESRRQIMLRDIKLKRDACQSAGAMTPYGRIDTDEASRTKLTGSFAMALALGDLYDDVWTMADGSDVEVDKDKILEIGLAVGQHVSACQRRKKTLEGAIVTATTLEALLAIEYLADWP